jgi:uncharacterized protein (DUF1778 family)
MRDMMMANKKDKRQKRDNTLHIYLSDEEWEILERAAKKKYLNKGAFSRSAIMVVAEKIIDQ